MRRAWIAALFLAGCVQVSEVRSSDLWLQVESATSIALENGEARATTARHELRVADGRLWLDGRDHGPVERGARVRLKRSGKLFVDGERRGPVP